MLFDRDPGVNGESYESMVARILKAIGGSGMSLDDLKVVLNLYLDTMASHSITNDKRLFKNCEPGNIKSIRVKDWQDRETIISQGGDTIFGPMMYSAGASCTILAGYEVEKTCSLEWTDNKIEVLVTSLVDTNVKLLFKTNEQRVLGCMDVPSAIIEKINSEDNIGVYMEDYADATVAAVLCQGGHARSMEAIHAHSCMGHPGDTQLITTLDMGILQHCPINGNDVRNVKCILGDKCIHCSIGKSQLMKSQLDLPRGQHKDEVVVKHHLPDVEKVFSGDVHSVDEVLGIDLMYIDGYTYMVSCGRNKGYTHSVGVSSKKKGALLKGMQLIINDYNKYNIKVVGIADCRVKSLESDNEPSIVSIAAACIDGITVDFKVAGEHIAYVERKIRHIKERVSAVRVSLYWNVTGKVLTWLVSFITMWINLLHSARAPLSAWINMGNTACNYRDLTRTCFGDVVIAHQPRRPTSEGEPKGEVGISLGANPRQPGAIFFYGFVTKMIKTRYRFKKHNDVDPIFYFGRNKYYVQQASIATSYLKYVTEHRVAVVPVIDADTYTMPNAQGVDIGVTVSAVNDPAPGCFIHEVNTASFRDESVKSDVSNIEPAEVEAVAMKIIIESNDEDAVRAIAMRVLSDISDGNMTPTSDTIIPDATETETEVDEAEVEEMASKLRAFALREDKIYGMIMAAKVGETTNMNWSKAISKSANASGVSQVVKESIDKELSQICVEYDVCEPVDYRVGNYHRSHDLYDTVKDKARLVVGRTISQMLIDYGVDINSPTINPKLIMVVLAMCVEEDLEFEVWDVKGAFLKAKCPNSNIHVRIEPHIAKMMIELLKSRNDEKHKLYTDMLRPDGSLMMNVKKGWYGLSAASALWNKEIDSTLVDDAGYTKSLTDPCLYYKDTEYGRAYIMLHVDDMGVMIRKGNPEREKVLKILEDKYEKMKIQTGDDVKYIGMELHRNRVDKRFEISMETYVEKIALNHGINLDQHVNNPSKNVKFSDRTTTADEENASNKPVANITKYRSLVMSMQYGTLVLPSIKYHVINLATKQSKPTVGDYQRAVRVLEFMICRRKKKLYISGFGKDPAIYMYTDAAFDVYSDSMSHSGLCVFIGNAGAAVYCCSNKQKCVTRSSTGAEIVAAESGLILGEYYRCVMSELGYECRVIQYQDNMSCICLVDTGYSQYDKKDRHTIRRINLMHDHFLDESHHAVMVWCETLRMIADGLTKDLHGTSFEVNENILMGHPVDINYDVGVD